jgi:DNA-binding transcriptional regulator YiaG
MVNKMNDAKETFRDELARAGLSLNGFARLARVSTRTVRYWLNNEARAAAPGYAWALLDLHNENQRLQARLNAIALTARAPL